MKNFLFNEKEKDINKWYKEICTAAEFSDYGDVKGTIVIQPFALAIWKKIQNILDERLRELEVLELKMPSLFKFENLQKEKDHFDGFLPEVPIITRVGEKKLSQEIVLAPTSELLFCNYFKNKLQNYKQLPFKFYQWSDVFRWESNTKPFLRNSQFLWHEGHCLYENVKENEIFCQIIFKLYLDIMQNKLLLPVIWGQKTNIEKFFGALKTYTIETFAPNGYAIQSATVHNLDNNFSKEFNVKYQNEKNSYSIPYQNSWGFSTRLIGALVLVHGDNNGMILPSKIAPYHVVIISEKNDDFFKKHISKIKENFKNNFEFFIDEKYNFEFKGRKKNWIMKGVPILIILKNEKLNLISRFDLNRTEVSIANMKSFIEQSLIKSDNYLAESANSYLNKRLVEIKNEADFSLINKKDLVFKAYTCMNEKKEIFIKKKYFLTIRCFKKVAKTGSCIYCGTNVDTVSFFAKSF